MIELDRYVDRIHGVYGKLISTGLGVKANAVKHQIEIGAFFAAQGAAKYPLPGREFLLDQIAESRNGSAHKLSPRSVVRSQPPVASGKRREASERDLSFTRKRESI